MANEMGGPPPTAEPKPNGPTHDLTKSNLSCFKRKMQPIEVQRMWSDSPLTTADSRDAPLAAERGPLRKSVSEPSVDDPQKDWARSMEEIEDPTDPKIVKLRQKHLDQQRAAAGGGAPSVPPAQGARLPPNFPRHQAVRGVTEFARYLANASYIISAGGSPVGDIKYGIIVVPAGEEHLLFGHEPDNIVNVDFMEALKNIRATWTNGSGTAVRDEDDNYIDPRRDNGRLRFIEDQRIRRAESFDNVVMSPPRKIGGDGDGPKKSQSSKQKCTAEHQPTHEEAPPFPAAPVANTRTRGAKTGGKRKAAKSRDASEPDEASKPPRKSQRIGAVQAAKKRALPAKTKTPAARKGEN